MVEFRAASTSHFHGKAQTSDAVTLAGESGIFGSATPEALDVLKEAVEPIALHRNQVLVSQGLPINSAFFLASGLVSFSVSDRANGVVEAFSIGRGECVGLTELFEARKSPYRAIVYVPGFAYKIDFASLQRLAIAEPSVMAGLVSGLVRLTTRQSYLIACQKSHSLKQRLARFLLTTSDQLHSSRIGVTHKIMAEALGVRRAGVTDQLQAFASDGLIEGQRGQVTIQDREKLLAISCPCAMHLSAIRAPLAMS